MIEGHPSPPTQYIGRVDRRVYCRLQAIEACRTNPLGGWLSHLVSLFLHRERKHRHSRIVAGKEMGLTRPLHRFRPDCLRNAHFVWEGFSQFLVLVSMYCTRAPAYFMRPLLSVRWLRSWTLLKHDRGSWRPSILSISDVVKILQTVMSANVVKRRLYGVLCCFSLFLFRHNCSLSSLKGPCDVISTTALRCSKTLLTELHSLSLYLKGPFSWEVKIHWLSNGSIMRCSFSALLKNQQKTGQKLQCSEEDGWRSATKHKKIMRRREPPTTDNAQRPSMRWLERENNQEPQDSIIPYGSIWWQCHTRE